MLLRVSFFFLLLFRVVYVYFDYNVIVDFIRVYCIFKVEILFWGWCSIMIIMEMYILMYIGQFLLLKLQVYWSLGSRCGCIFYFFFIFQYCKREFIYLFNCLFIFMNYNCQICYGLVFFFMGFFFIFQCFYCVVCFKQIKFGQYCNFIWKLGFVYIGFKDVSMDFEVN